MLQQSHLPITGAVLVADDQAANCELLEELLTAQGCKVTTVPDGAAALEELTRTQFDLVLLDVMMPHLSGARKVFRRFQFALHKSLVDDNLRGDVRQFPSLPCLHLLSHRLKVSLHPIYTHFICRAYENQVYPANSVLRTCFSASLQPLLG